MVKAKIKHSTPNHVARPVALDEDDEEPRREVACSIYVEVSTGGRRPGQEPVPLHEIPLLERKVRSMQASIEAICLSKVHAPERRRESAPVAHKRGHTLQEIEDLFAVLQRKYTFLPEGAKEGDEVHLVDSIYGTGKEGLKALAITMRRLDAGFESFMDSMGEREPAKADFMKYIAANGPRAALQDEIEAEILAN
jgi:hypothetical protein